MAGLMASKSTRIKRGKKEVSGPRKPKDVVVSPWE